VSRLAAYVRFTAYHPLKYPVQPDDKGCNTVGIRLACEPLMSEVRESVANAGISGPKAGAHPTGGRVDDRWRLGAPPMEDEALAAWRVEGPEGLSTCPVAHDPRSTNPRVLTSSTDVDPVLPPRTEGGASPL
jgi:hypothetical protein